MTATLIFLVSAAFIVYVIFGYALLAALAARFRSRPVERRPIVVPVTVLMCVHNGEKWIREKIRSILALDYPREKMQILVVSDGSTDRSEAIAREFAGDGVRLLALPKGGKAAAINAGLAEATGEIVFFTDVRQPLDPGCLKSLVSCLADPQVGAVCGHVLFIGDSTGAHMGMYWRYEKWIRNSQTRLDSIQAGTGCLYAMRRDLTVPVPADTLLDDTYLPLSACLRGYRFILDSGAIAYEYPTSLDTEFRRKVRTLAGIYQLIGYFPALLSPSNRMWIHFASYKLGRLLLPFAMIALAVSSFGLPAPARNIALIGQAIFYGLGAADPLLPKNFPLKRLTSLIRTFLVLMAASLCAVSIFFRPPRSLWKETRIAAPRT